MPRRAITSRILRFTATALASLGLLGHGLAMLLVGLLGSAPATAEPGFPAFLEICRVGGDVAATADASGMTGTPTDSPHHPAGPAQGGIDGCPVCNAFAQIGADGLTASIIVAEPASGPAAPPPAGARSRKAASAFHALSRAPPIGA